MKRLATIFIAMFSVSTYADSSNGLERIQSQSDVTRTTERLVTVLKDAGMTVFATIDHASAAKKVGTNLKPTQLVIFGNAKIGSKLMQCQQTVAIDLPQKALINEDQNGTVWITYNQPSYLAKRHNLTGCDKVLQKVEAALSALFKKAAKPNTP